MDKTLKEKRDEILKVAASHGASDISLRTETASSLSLTV